MSRNSVLVLDAGSAWARAGLAGRSARIPAAVARRTRPPTASGDVLAGLGAEARALHGRIPEGAAAVRLSRPFRQGRVVDLAGAVAVVRALLSTLQAPRRLRLALPVDVDAPPAVLEEWQQLARRLGDSAPRLVPHAVAAARGAGLPADAPAAMVVDIGEARTRISVLSGGTPVTSAVFELGGETFDGAVVRHLRREHALQVGPSTAERVKLLAARGDPCPAAGRCLRRGVPRAVVLHAGEVAPALLEPIAPMAAAIRRVLESAPEGIAAEVVAQGILLVGGAAALPGLDAALRRETALAFVVADAPDEAVLRGLALIAHPLDGSPS